MLEYQLDILKNKQSLLAHKKNEVEASTSKRPTYNIEDISFATNVYSAGPRCYRLLRSKGYSLPSPTTLRRWSSKLCVEPGIQYQTLSHMSSLDMPLEEKLCVISFDEMKCREEWAYDKKADKIIPPKRMVQVVMVRGLRGKWKQPIYYDFDCKMEKATLLLIIEELYKIGFTVVAAVSDLGTENQQLWKSMAITMENVFFKHPSNQNNIIFVFSDVPHLIKLLRNHFLDDGLHYKNKILKKFIVEELLTYCNSDLNITKSLSSEMLNVKGAGMYLYFLLY